MTRFPLPPREGVGPEDGVRFLRDVFAWMGRVKKHQDDRFFEGDGSPEGVVAARVGALYTRLDGGAGTTLYVKEAGGVSSTGWAAK